MLFLMKLACHVRCPAFRRQSGGARLSQPQRVRQPKTRGISCARSAILAAAGGTPALRSICPDRLKAGHQTSSVSSCAIAKGGCS